MIFDYVDADKLEPGMWVNHTTVNEHPAAVKRDGLDMMAQACSDEITERWIPIAVPVREPKVARPPIQYAGRYTGLPAMMIH